MTETVFKARVEIIKLKAESAAMMARCADASSQGHQSARGWYDASAQIDELVKELEALTEKMWVEGPSE